MNTDREVLFLILTTARAGQVQIQSFLDCTAVPALKSTLDARLQEFRFIEGQSCTIASARGWDIPEPVWGKQTAAGLSSRFKLGRGNRESKIAESLILSNTKAMIAELRFFHQSQQTDSQIRFLSQKLFDCQTALIRQMRDYL